MLFLSVEYHVSYVCDCDFDARIGLDLIAYLISCVDDCGVVASTEHLADLHEWRGQKLGDEIDCDHSRLDNALGFLL